MKNGYSLLLQRQGDLRLRKRFLGHVEHFELLHALNVIRLFSHKLLVLLLFGSQMLHHLVDFREGVQILTSQFLAKLFVFADLFANVLKLTLVLCAFHIAFFVLLCDILRQSRDISVDLALMISPDRRSEAEFFLCTHEKDSSVKILVPFIIPCLFAFFNKNFANS